MVEYPGDPGWLIVAVANELPALVPVEALEAACYERMAVMQPGQTDTALLTDGMRVTFTRFEGGLALVEAQGERTE